ncbi:MAG TPA: MaoC family dehydratase N-terminal domain-containing protein [Burkholderiales bacterium]|jgi:hypothetical protein|nr:MaoC family dehydratase N-terminal domain-containing protein [Burkholderiales bacterium]
MGALLTPEIEKYIGLESEPQLACEPVEKGAVRRHAQAVMDPDPIYMDEAYVRDTRYGKPVAPPLFPVTMLRAPFGSPDLVTERAKNAYFDGILDTTSLGLPRLPLVNSSQLTGTVEVELYRYAEHGEAVWVQSRYRDIYERETSRGLLLFVIIETDFRDAAGGLICRFTKVQARG